MMYATETDSRPEVDSLLVIDVGEINTRALLFDVVDGRYRFLAVGSASTTAAAPYNDVGEGVRVSLDRLQEISGRKLVDQVEGLLMPARADGSGVDALTAVISAGPPLKVVAVGLLEDVSLESACRLAATTYTEILETVALSDSRKHEERIDAILRVRPDLVIIAGGTEGGASRSVLQMVESVGLACYLLPEGYRPEVLYTGNQALVEEIQGLLEPYVNLRVAENIRPALDMEQLGPARSELVQTVADVRLRSIPGLQELANWSGKSLRPAASAFGQLINFLSKVYDPAKGVMGIEVGASATTLAVAFGGEGSLGVYPHLGLGQRITELLKHNRIEEITRWLPMEVSNDYVLDYIYTKSIYPQSLPVTAEDLAIEQALARQAIATALVYARKGFPKSAGNSGVGLLPWFEPIVGAGSAVARAPSYAHSLLMLLDALQPTGVTTIVLDQNGLTAPLGALAELNPLMAVQVIESSTYLNLATVISPVCDVRPGTPMVRVKVTYETGDEIGLEVKRGGLEVVPLPLGKSAVLHLQPLHRADVGMGGAGISGTVRVIGGVLGVVIDARGRPLDLPADGGRRRELLKKWLWTLGN